MIETGVDGQQFIQHDPQTVNVAATVDTMSFPAGLLGAHVVRGSRQAFASTKVFFPQRNAEVRQECSALRVDQNVGRLDIAMHQPFE